MDKYDKWPTIFDNGLGCIGNIWFITITLWERQVRGHASNGAKGVFLLMTALNWNLEFRLTRDVDWPSQQISTKYRCSQFVWESVWMDIAL